jgi:hypothetical protein
MSTPIKPPGHTDPLGGAGPTDGSQPSTVEGRPGELRSLVQESQLEPASADATARTEASASPLGAIRADLAAGRIDVDEAVERLVDRAMAKASGLPTAQRAALEAQLRAALAEDPTLIALRKDLERAQQT